MSTRTKGNQYENEVKAILERDGWVVEKARAYLVWIKGRALAKAHDFFGSWDLIAKKVNEPTLWVQVSTWEHASDKRKQVQDFPSTDNVDICAIYGRKGGRGAHYRILYKHKDYRWDGDVAMVSKKK